MPLYVSHRHGACALCEQSGDNTRVRFAYGVDRRQYLERSQVPVGKHLAHGNFGLVHPRSSIGRGGV